MVERAAASVPYVILGNARTGTTLLVDIIAQHRDAACFGEILNSTWVSENRPIDWPAFFTHRVTADQLAHGEQLRQSGRIAFIEWLHETTAATGRTAIGFKLLYGHAYDQPDVAEYLAQQERVRVIHVRRRNRLRRYLSHQRAEQSGSWTSHQAGRSAGPITLDWDACVRDFEDWDEAEAKIDEVFGARAMLQIVYEDFVADLEAGAAEVHRFLSLEPCPVEPRLGKQGGRSLRDAIANFDELAATAAGTRWASFFEDDA